VSAARRAYRLPYRHARIHAEGDLFRADIDGHGSFRADYHPVGAQAPAERGTLEYFLVERYCLYAGDGELRADIHHPPWPLQPAEADVSHQGIAPVEVDGEPICHFARRQDVVVWWPEAYREP
jgi:uncharacterized protein